ncbi:MAG: BNR-repeat neuraminidase N-terminal domain-containing protein [Ferruginibacter sp.]
MKINFFVSLTVWILKFRLLISAIILFCSNSIDAQNKDSIHGFSPVNITDISDNAGPFGSRLIHIITRANPASSENIFLRYSMDNFSTSTIVQATGSGTEWVAEIPWQRSTIKYYAYSSNKTKVEIDKAVLRHGQSAHDITALSINNNAGRSYPWTPLTGNLIVTSVGGTCSGGCTFNSFSENDAFFNTYNNFPSRFQGTVTVLVTADISDESGDHGLNYNAVTTSLAIRPSGDRNISSTTVVGGAFGKPILRFSGVNNLLIDGLNDGSNSLTISKYDGGYSAGIGGTISFTGKTTNSTITNCTILGAGTGYTSGATISFLIDDNPSHSNLLDNFTIVDNKIGSIAPGDLLNSPRRAIYVGNFSKAVSTGINITRNSIYDYWESGIDIRGMGIASITDNKFYQTTPKTIGNLIIHSAIKIANDDHYYIADNRIGFASGNALGIYTISGGGFNAIDIDGDATTASTIENNTINSINYTGNFFRGIYTHNHTRAVISANNIGTQGLTGSISITAGTAYGINHESDNPVDISGNTLGGISSSGHLNVIDTHFSDAVTISLNTIGGTVSNSINGNSTVNGIAVFGVSGTIAQNQIRNLTGEELTGLFFSTPGQNNSVVSENEIHDLKSTGANYDQAFAGIKLLQPYTGSGLVTLRRNMIYGLTTGTQASFITGIYCEPSNASIRNNVIALGAGVTRSVNINGIRLNDAVGPSTFWHNSIYISGASSVAGTAKTFAFNSSDVSGNSCDIRNNIFANSRSSLGKNYSIHVGGNTPAPPGLILDYNAYDADGSSTYLGYFNNQEMPDLHSWRNFVGTDNHSLSGDPKFKDPDNPIPDLHIHATNSTIIEGTGIDVGVTNDFDGQTRSGLTPTDIGADAGNFNAASILAFSSSITVQQTGFVCAGARNIPVIRMEVIMSGAVGTKSLSSIRINGTGTSNFSDIGSYRIYYTGNQSSFDTLDPISNAATGLNGTNTIVTPSTSVLLLPGKNYFWLAYNLASTLTGTYFDAQCTQILLSTGGGVPTITNPGGVVTINSAPEILNVTPASVCYNSSGSMSAISPAGCIIDWVNSGTSFGGSWNSSSPSAKLPTNNMSNSSLCSFDGLSIGNYTAINFRVSVAGSYTFEMANDPGFDGRAYLVSGAFVPGNCSGGGTWIKGDDDGSPLGDEPLITTSLFPNVTYTMISTNSYLPGLYAGNFNWNITGPAGSYIRLPLPAGNIEWYTQPYGGLSIGSGSPFNPVGVANSNITNTSTDGTTTFYAACSNTGTCRTAVNFVVHYTPAAFSGLHSHYCINEPASQLTGSPIGGVFTGNGISGNNFSPVNAGIGEHAVVYQYTDPYGCVTFQNGGTVVGGFPSVDFTGLATAYCTSDGSITLTGSPVGGMFSGPGISGNSFSPGLAGNGSHNITYTYTNFYGCTNSAIKQVNVNICNSPITVNLKLYLQGYYTGAGLMQPVFYNQSMQQVLSNETDFLTVELHDPTNFTFIESKNAVLHTDGTVTVNFIRPAGSYYVAILHRNTLQTWSNSPIAFSSTTPLYDFSTAANKAFAANQVMVEPGIWAFFTGDINQDEYIDGNDFPLYDSESASGGLYDGTYTVTDMNGDGFVDGNDFPVYDVNSSNGASSLHP